MTDLLSYSLTDFVPFSWTTYQRLLERYDARFWPAVVLGFGIGLVTLGLLGGSVRAPSGLIAATRFLRLSRLTSRLGSGSAAGPLLIVFGLCWLWIAWAFHWQSYALLNWAGAYFAGAFVLQGGLLIGSGIRMAGRPVNADWDVLAWAGYGLVAFAVIGMPLIGSLSGFWLEGRAWLGLELFGSAPDPTALATLGLIAVLRPPFAWMLALLPTLWCLISAATLAGLGDPLWPLQPLAIVLTVLTALLVRMTRVTRFQGRR